jgi:hypothetical protein
MRRLVITGAVALSGLCYAQDPALKQGKDKSAWTKDQGGELREARREAVKSVFETAATAKGVKVTCVCQGSGRPNLASRDCPTAKRNTCDCGPGGEQPVVTCGS